jgi:hypothetical protein
MLVIQRMGRYAGQTIDLPVPEAREAVKAGRADPLPGEEWRFPVTVVRGGGKSVETTMVRPQQEVRRKRGRPRKNKRV